MSTPETILNKAASQPRKKESIRSTNQEAGRPLGLELGMLKSSTTYSGTRLFAVFSSTITKN